MHIEFNLKVDRSGIENDISIEIQSLNNGCGSSLIVYTDQLAIRRFQLKLIGF